MKIYCENCKKNISGYVERNIDEYRVGYVICPYCKQKQKRYISESDLLLYFAISELFYLVLSIITIILLNLANGIWMMLAICIPLLIIGFIIQRQIIHKIYLNAYGKKEYANIDLKEDGPAIIKSISWQYMLFFALAITFITVSEAKIFFGIMCVISVCLSFLKYYLCIKKEKEKLIVKN